MSELQKWLSIQNVLSNLLIELDKMAKEQGVSNQKLQQIENMKIKATEARTEVVNHILLTSIENHHDKQAKRTFSEAVS